MTLSFVDKNRSSAFGAVVESSACRTDARGGRRIDGQAEAAHHTEIGPGLPRWRSADGRRRRGSADHALAGEIGQTLATMPLVANVLPVETNIVIFTLAEDGPTAAALVELLRDDGVRVGAFGERQIRIVTHIGVDGGDGRRLCESLAKHLT